MTNKEVLREKEAIREARYMQNAFWERGALPNWQPCPNCGERYAPTSMGPHVKRCRRLRPKGINGGGAGATASAGSSPFDGMWGVDQRPLPKPSTLELLGESLKHLVGGGEKEPEPEAAPAMDDETRQRLHALFTKFDENGDGRLSQREHGMLLFNCFPDRMLDAKSLLEEFKTVDADGSGTVSFDEFVRYYGEMVLSQASTDFDEAADMFAFFDADCSGELDEREFLSLLNNIFPDHCDENDAAVATEFAAADTDGSSGISFTEFCAYYERLRTLYGDTKPLTPDEIKQAAATAKRKAQKSAAAAVPAPPPTIAGPGASKASKGKTAAGKAKGAKPAAAAPTTAPAAPDKPLAERMAQLDDLLRSGLITQAEYDAKRDALRGERMAQLDELLSTGLVTKAEYDAKRDELLGPASGTAAVSPPPSQSLREELVVCSGCGESFLPHVLPRHQRSCAAVRPTKGKKSVRFQPPTPPQDPLSSDAPDRPLPVMREVASIEYAENGSNSFVPCEKCGRTFFPDRLPIHVRACKGGKAGAAQEAAAEEGPQ